MGIVQRSTLHGGNSSLRHPGWRGARRAPCQMSNYLTIPEVAARVRCEHRVIRKAIHRGELEAAMIGARWLIREEAVDAWFEARTARRAAPVRQRATPRARPTTEGQRSVARLREMERDH